MLALVVIGFAHKPDLALASPSTAGLAAYVLPDGSLPILCLGNHGDDDDGMADRDCDACRLVSTSLIPMPADAAGEIVRRPAGIVVAASAEATFRRLYPPSTGPRAPPYIVKTV